MFISDMDLERLGFEKHVVSPEESGTVNGYYYYELPLSDTNTDFCLISQESDQVKNGAYLVKLFQTDDYVFSDRMDLRRFVEAVLSHKKSTE